MTRILIPLLALALAASARADVVLGKKSSCSAVWDTGTAGVTAGTVPTLSCTDGDPSCDTDGAVSGSCTLHVKACNGTDTGSCVPAPLASALRFNGKAKASGFSDPGVGACSTGSVQIKLHRHPKNPNKTLKKYTAAKPALLTMKAQKFANILKVKCLPCTGTGCGTTTTTLPNACPADSAGVLTITVPLEDRNNPQQGNGSDLDNGWTGTSHNFPVIGGSSLKYCLSGCDGKTTFDCKGSGSTGGGSALNGQTFGAPLPLLAANVPVCVVNEFVDQTLAGTFNLQTGDSGTQTPNLVHLTSQVYLRTSFTGEVCPKCQGPNATGIGGKGTCSSSAKNAGADCTIDGEVTVAGKGSYELSSDCTPLGDSPPTGLDIRLEFTTGSTSSAPGPRPCPGQTQDDACAGGQCNAGCTGAACVATNGAGQCVDAKGGLSQLCCSNNTATPCFLTRSGGTITRQGTPAPPGGTQVAATTFCIPATDSTLINVTTGLPGPGALLLPGRVTFTPAKK
jgi:hypothetical protein